MHKNYFHWDIHVTVLVEQLDIRKPWGLMIVAAIFVVLSGLHEGLRCLRLCLAEKQVKSKVKPHPWSPYHIVQTVLYLVDFTFSYAAMLMVMTFNLWIFLAVILGTALGWHICQCVTHGHNIGTLLMGDVIRAQYEGEVALRPADEGSEGTPWVRKGEEGEGVGDNRDSCHHNAHKDDNGHNRTGNKRNHNGHRKSPCKERENNNSLSPSKESLQLIASV